MRYRAFLCLAVLLLSVVTPGALATGRPLDQLTKEDLQHPVRIMLQLQSPPIADVAEDMSSLHRLSLQKEHDRFRGVLRQSGVRYRELATYQSLFNGIAIQVDRAQIGRVHQLPGVKHLFLSNPVQMPKPDLSSSVGMIRAPRAWTGDESKRIPGVKGAGIRVAIIDTGIDYNHPDLGGCYGLTCRVIGGYDFVGDDFNGDNDPVPDFDPMDQNGHGTHVAGIVGANAANEEGVTGVAPGVSFLALKVFGPQGSTYTDIVVSALEMSYWMRADVVNLSLGSAFGWPQAPDAQAARRLSNRGVIVVASAGNSGDAGEYATGAPAISPGVISVASFENDAALLFAFLDGTQQKVGYNTITFSPAFPTQGGSAEVVYAGRGARDADFLAPDGTSRVQGKVALIERGDVSFQDKVLNAKRHGAVQAIIFNNRPGRVLATLQAPGDYIPAVTISQAEGQRLLAQLATQSLRLTWLDGLHRFASDTAGLLSDFSSWGPSPDLSIKPDLTAPGGKIYSTYPLALGGYAVLSGTSMASPHVAGAAALILAARRQMENQQAKRFKPSAVRTLMMNTALPRTVGVTSDERYPVHAQGAGMIDVWRAITAQQRVLPDKIEFGEVEQETSLTQKITIENLSAKDQVYRFALVSAQGAELALTPGPTELHVAAGKSNQAEVQFTLPTTAEGEGLFSGWVVVKNQDDERIAHIPYLGYRGDYQAASALDPLEYNLPLLLGLSDEGWYQADPLRISPDCGCNQEHAWIFYSLARHAQQFRIEIWDAQSGSQRGMALQAQYLGRSAGWIESFEWDGRNDKGKKLPAGRYRLRLRVLRPLGNPDNLSHWDNWESGVIDLTWGS